MKTKRLLTVLLTVALAVILLAVGVSAAEIVDSGTCGDNLTWVLDSDEVLTISGIGAMENYDDEWNYAPWRSWTEELQEVVIESGVTSIGSYAFYECQNLTDITLPEGITTIGEYAFYDCRGLTSFTIPESASTLSEAAGGVGDYAFAKCRNLTSVTLSESMTSIGGSAFYECNKLTSIKLPKKVTSIGEDAFFCCYELSDINIPTGLTSIEKRVFYGCNSLPDIVLPDGVTSIGEDAFSNCESMTSITIPESVKSIGDSAFSDCESLVSITIPKGVTSIGVGTFYRCRELTSITIPEGVTSIGKNAFYLCDKLPSVTLPETLTTIGDDAFCQCSSLSDIAIPKNVTSIGDSAFSDCSSLTSITVPEGVTSIGMSVFGLCSNLKSVTLPESVTSIGMFAFSSCSSLTSIDLPDGVISIGDRAFTFCDGLTDITLPEALTSIGSFAFNECNNLRTITFKGNGPTIGENSFYEVTATAYYPANDDSWTEDVMQDYGGKLTWLVEGSGKPLAILQQPKNTYTKAGKTAKVTMEVQGSGLKYQWYIKNAGQKKYSKSSVTSATYSCKMNEKSKDRLAYCIITDAEGNRVKSKTVILREAASITSQPQDAQAQSGNTVKVTVKASGDGLKYQWYVKNAGAKKFTKSSVTKATYSTKMREAAQGRQIYCVVTDTYGKTAKSKTVTLGMTVSITQQPQNACGNYGDTLRISLGASGDGLSYQWYVKNAGGSKFSKSSITSATYSCKLNEKSAGRQVYCIVTDTYGNTAKSATATIYKELRITSQPADVTVAEGQTAKVSFQAEGDGLTYTWYFKDVDDNGFKKTSTFTGNTYSVKMSAARDGRWVYCVVTDAYGNALSTEMVRLRMK